MEILLSIAVALLAGLMMTRLIKPLGLPAVTGYLIAGILIGPFCLGHFGIDGLGITKASLEHFELFSNVALGFIAFSIGNEFRISQLRQIGKQATVIAIVQALTATLFVDAALIVLHFLVPKGALPLSVAITLGAVATATAPAATLMVIRQYKAKGKVTDILLPVVALDDAVGLVVFAVSFGIAKGLAGGNIDIFSILINPLVEIVASLVLGAVVGFVFSEVEKLFHSRSKRLAVSVMFVILTVALTMIKYEHQIGKVGTFHLGFSPLLACMMLGTVFCNMCESSEELMDRVDRWTTPLFALFFVISGADLNLGAFSNWVIVLIGVVYIAFRSLGKYFGAFGSAKLMKCEDTIVKYLGITLLPQAGVALGMAKIVMQEPGFGTEGEIIRDVVLFSVLIYELVGPMLTKIALTKAGEIIPHERKSSKVINADRQK